MEKNGKKKGLTKEQISKEKEWVELLEDMSIMGTIMKKQIEKEEKTNPEKFISKEEIIEQKDDDKDLYALGIFSEALKGQGMTTAIERENKGDGNNSSQTLLQFLVNGMSQKSKYNLHFDFGNKRNKELLNNKIERKKFHDKLRKKLSKETNINEEDILIIFPRSGSYEISATFKSKDPNLSEDELLAKLKKGNDEFSKIQKIKKGIILDGCKLSKNMLDSRGDNMDGGGKWMVKKGGKNISLPKVGLDMD